MKRPVFMIEVNLKYSPQFSGALFELWHNTLSEARVPVTRLCNQEQFDHWAQHVTWIRVESGGWKGQQAYFTPYQKKEYDSLSNKIPEPFDYN